MGYDQQYEIAKIKFHLLHRVMKLLQNYFSFLCFTQFIISEILKCDTAFAAAQQLPVSSNFRIAAALISGSMSAPARGGLGEADSDFTAESGFLGGRPRPRLDGMYPVILFIVPTDRSKCNPVAQLRLPFSRQCFLTLCLNSSDISLKLLYFLRGFLSGNSYLNIELGCTTWPSFGYLLAGDGVIATLFFPFRSSISRYFLGGSYFSSLWKPLLEDTLYLYLAAPKIIYGLCCAAFYNIFDNLGVSPKALIIISGLYFCNPQNIPSRIHYRNVCRLLSSTRLPNHSLDYAQFMLNNQPLALPPPTRYASAMSY